MKLTYRNATITDLAVIVEIYNSTVASRLVTADTEPVTVESRVNWFDAHDPVLRPLLIAENEHGNTVGWVSFKSFYGRPAYNGTVELAIYIHTDFRYMGYGKKMLHYSLEIAQSIGIKTLLGFIFEHNKPSLKLFSGSGFEQWALLPRVAEMDGREYSLIIVGKRIQP